MAVEHRMEQLLQYWEMYWYATNANYRLVKNAPKPFPVPFTGPVKWWNQLRRDIINHDVFTYYNERYAPSKEAINFLNITPSVLLTPIIIGKWVLSSRRIFKLDTDLQFLLDMTSLRGVRIRDIQFPFDSFAVALDKPLVGEKGRFYDFIVASKLERNDVPGYYLAFYDQRLEVPPPVTPRDKEIIEQFIAKGGGDKGVERLARCWGGGRLAIPFGTGHFIPTSNLDMKVLEACKLDQLELPDGLDSTDTLQVANVAEALSRVVLGMCMYLRTLPSPNTSRLPWKPVKPLREFSNLAKSIPVIDESTICFVESRFKLSIKERIAFSDPEHIPTRSLLEKCCHVRSGFWHRPPGTGHDSLQAKTQWTRPTIVREDKYVPGTLLKGAEKLLKVM